MKWFVRFAILLLMCVAGGFAAAGVPVSGSVSDPSGLPIPGATVTLTGSAGAAQSATAGTDGTFHFVSVVPGAYHLQASSAGFRPVSQQIRISSTPQPIRLTLKIVEVQQSVTVTEQAAAAVTPEPSQNADSVTLDRNMLDDMPVMDDDIVAAASEYLDTGALGGGSASLVVDGVEVDELGVSPSAVQEVKVNNNPYSAEYSRPGRGRIEIITKQGTSEYHGSMSFRMRDYHLDARNAFAETRPPTQRRAYEGHLSGPIGHSQKNMFLLSAEREEDDQQSVVYADTPNGLNNSIVASPERNNRFSARFNRYHSDTQSFSFHYQFQRDNAEGQGTGGFSLPDAAYSSSSTRQTGYINHRWFPNARWLTELNVRIRRTGDSTDSLNPDARKLVVLDAMTLGGAQRNGHDATREVEGTFIASYNAGRHYLRMGFLLPENEHHSVDDRNNFGGTYYFRTLADYVSGVPYSYTQRAGDSRIKFWKRQVAGFAQDDIKLRPNILLGLGLRYEIQNYIGDHNNFAPRVSLAIGLGKQGKTVLRTGTGIFFDRTGDSVIADRLQLDGVRLREIQIQNPLWPSPDFTSAESVPPSVFEFANNLRNPYLYQANAGIERELRQSLSLSVNYTWLRGIHLYRSLDANAPVAPYWTRPNTAWNTVTQMESSGDMKSHSLNVSVRGRFSKRLRGSVMYTFGRAQNNTDGAESLPPDSYNLNSQWGPASFDRRHNFRLFGSVELPEGMNLGTSLFVSSGTPYEWTTGDDLNQDGRANERPDGVSRNALRGPGRTSWNIRFAKTIQLRSAAENGPRLRLRLDAFNILNQVNYTQFVGNQSSVFFRTAVAASTARRMQASVRFEF